MIDALKSHFPGFLDPTNLVTVVSDFSPILRQMHGTRLQRKAQASRCQAPSGTLPRTISPLSDAVHKIPRPPRCFLQHHESHLFVRRYDVAGNAGRVTTLISPHSGLHIAGGITWPASRVYYAALDLADEMAISTNSFGPGVGRGSRRQAFAAVSPFT